MKIVKEGDCAVIRICIIGVSGYGRIHYDLARHCVEKGKARFVGATIINPSEEAEKCAYLTEMGCPLFTDYRQMLGALKGKADLCMIPTGTALHRPMTVAALEAGMHVLVEKPVAGCIDDANAMMQAAEKASRTVAVGYQHMYTPAAMAAKQHILKGTIGVVESIKCMVLWPRAQSYYARNNWAGKLYVDGIPVNDTPFNNAVAHDLMMMLFQAGATEREAALPVAAEAELYRANEIESADTACICVQTAEGIPVRFYATHACRRQINPKIHITGSKGSIFLSHDGAVISPDDGEQITVPVDGGPGARQSMMDAVLDAVQGGSSFICDLETASRQTMVVEAIHTTCAIQSVRGEEAHSGTAKAATCIPGIEEVMSRAFLEEKLFRECGIRLEMESASTEGSRC